MAIESIAITEGAGRDVAVDSVGGKDYQVFKPAYGPDGAAALIEDAVPFPVRFGSPILPILSSGQISAATSGQNALLAGSALQTIRIFKFFIINVDISLSVNIKFRSGTNDFHPAIPLGPGASWILDFDGEPWFVTNVAEDFVLNLSAAVQISGRFYYAKS